MINNWQPYITFLKDIFSIISSVGLLIIAFLGLRTWSRQLKGTTKYELSRRVLRETYVFRDKVDRFRSFHFSGDTLADYEISIVLERLNDVTEVITNLEIDATEAEVVLGKKGKDAILELKDSYLSLTSAFEQYKHLTKPEMRKNQVVIETFRKIICKYRSDNEMDSYADKLNFRISNVEKQMGSFLRI